MTRLNFAFSFLNEEKLPLLIQSSNQKQAQVDCLVEFLKEKNDLFKENLLTYGALLFRGFNIRTPDEFFEVIQACSLGPNYQYDFCTVPRTKLREGISTASDVPAHLNLCLHNEKSYSSEYPSHVFFNCNIAPETGGCTVLADGHKIWCSLPSVLQHKLMDKGILYRKQYYGDGNQIKNRIINYFIKTPIFKTWMDEFKTDNKFKVEELLHHLGEEYRWKGNNLITKKLLPAYKHHPLTNKLVWFNQSNQLNVHANGFSEYLKQLTHNPIARKILLHKCMHPYLAYFGDGASFTKQEADCINQAFQKHTIANPWQSGDVLILDNYLCLHGKTPHTGDRLIFAGMTQYPYCNPVGKD